MNDKDLTLYVAIISCLATIAAAIIYYFTLNEIKKQRQSSYRPEVFIETSNFTIHVKKINNKIEDLIWSDAQQKNDQISSHCYNLHCHNLGLGAAKNVKIKFSFDIQSFIKKINALNDSYNVLNIKNNNIFSTYNFIEKEFEYNIAINRQLDNNKSINFILPVSYSNKINSFMIPKQYSLLYSFYFYLISYTDKSKTDFDIPQLFIELEYQDIYNDNHKKNFAIEFNMISLSKDIFHGYLNIK